MARSRNIKPGASKNEALAELGPMTQFLFVMLPCFADKEGRLEDRPKRIKAEILPYYDADVDAMLQSLADSEERFIVRYEVDGKRYLQITNFHEHQTPHHKEIESKIPDCPKNSSTSKQHKANHKPSLPQAPVKGIRNQESELKESGIREVSGFGKFWEVCHNKKDKRNAEKAYGHAIKRLAYEHPGVDPHGYLLERMTAFAATPEADPTDRTPILPTTWLNGGRYDDDPATWQRGSPNGKDTDPRGTFSAAQEYLADVESPKL
jgi:hypothetical protein